MFWGFHFDSHIVLRRQLNNNIHAPSESGWSGDVINGLDEKWTRKLESDYVTGRIMGQICFIFVCPRIWHFCFFFELIWFLCPPI